MLKSNRIIKKRSYKSFEPTQFLEAVKQISWWKLYSCDDLDEAVKIFHGELTNILDKMAPIRVFQVRNNYASWLSPITKQWMEIRNKALDKANATNSEGDWQHYKKIRNRVNNALKLEKKQWQTKKLNEASNDSGKTWNFVKLWLGWSKGGGSPTQLCINGSMIRKPLELAEKMNFFFIEKVRNIVKNIPFSDNDVLDLPKKLMFNRRCAFKFNSVHPDAVNKIISNMKTSKSCGIDSIDNYVIKLARVHLVPAITHILNLSINQSQFPTMWKTAKIIPLHKKGDQTNPKNYRPVALLSVLSKILEKAVFQQIMDYMELNNLFHPSHHGFRSGLSTTTALLEMQDFWLENFDKNRITAAVMLDLSSAFDVVRADILTKKMQVYGFDESILKWIASYLSGRHQQVYIDGYLSKPLQVDIGLPQGSILAPLLYTIYTNDLPEVVHKHVTQQILASEATQSTYYNLPCDKCGGICCFADDSTFSVSRQDPTELEEAITYNYKEIAEYMAMNRLSLNNEKTHFMILASSHNHKKHGNFGIVLNTGTESLQPTESERLLGVTVANDFTWNEHIEEMLKSLRIRSNGLRKVCWGVNFKTRKMLATGLIMSKLTYAVQVYGSASEYLLHSLQVQQNFAARIVTGLGWGTEKKTLLGQLGWLSVKQMYVYYSLLTVFKLQQTGKPSYFKGKFKMQFPYQTRQATNLCFSVDETPSSEALRRSFHFRSTSIWNSLPVDLRKISKLADFQSKVKSWVMKTIDI